MLISSWPENHLELVSGIHRGFCYEKNLIKVTFVLDAVCMSVCVNMLMHERMWRSEDNLRFLFSFLRQDVSVGPEFPALVRLAGQRSPRILLSPLPALALEA